MKSHPQAAGGFFVWHWSDSEIEQPRIIREALDDIQSQGFSGVLITLQNARYELIDTQVVHAVAQASQWAKSRKMLLWLQADPRRASRSLIAETDERTQYLVLPPGASGQSPEQSGVIVPVRDGQFNLQLPFPQLYPYSSIQEQAVRFDPAGLERAFIFQMDQGIILQNTVIDITPVTRFLADMNTQTVEIFGDVAVPETELWYVTAFARFETNLYDFAGRESNDILRHFVERLFDSVAYVDGVTWDTIGYPGGRWDFPVSLSIFNGFSAEYGYDLRDVLYALLFDVDSGLHLKVRRDYHHFLMESILDAQHDLYTLFHSYFGAIESILPVPLMSLHPEGSACCSLRTDHWPVVQQSTSAMAMLDWDCENLQVSDQFLTDLVLLRSQGVFSKNRKAYGHLTCPGQDFKQLQFCMDLLALFSIRGMMQNTEISCGGMGEGRGEWIPFGEQIPSLNERTAALLHLTGFRFPDADLAVILPVDTLMTEFYKTASLMLDGFRRLVACLVQQGFAFDILTSSALKDAKLKSGSVQLKHRLYRGMIFPYPKIVSPPLIDLIHALGRHSIPFWIGGLSPERTTEGEPVGQSFDVQFDPRSADPALFESVSESNRLRLPEHALGVWLHSGKGYHLMVCPDAPEQSVSGTGQLKEILFALPSLTRLTLFQLDPEGGLRKLI